MLDQLVKGGEVVAGARMHVLYQLYCGSHKVENKHYSTVSGLIRLVIISRMLY